MKTGVCDFCPVTMEHYHFPGWLELLRRRLR